MLEYATKKRKAKGADWIVANDVSPETGIMGGDRNTVHLVTAEGVESWPELDKGEVARRLMQRAAERLAEITAADMKRRKARQRGRRQPSASCDCRTAGSRSARLPVRRCRRHGPAGGGCRKRTPLQLAPGARALVPTGLVLELPLGFEAQVRPRSGLALRHGITVLNSPGTIDSDYRGEVQVLLANLGQEPFAIARGERIAQLVVQRVEQARSRRGRRDCRRRARRRRLRLDRQQGPRRSGAPVAREIVSGEW